MESVSDKHEDGTIDSTQCAPVGVALDSGQQLYWEHDLVAARFLALVAREAP